MSCTVAIHQMYPGRRITRSMTLLHGQHQTHTPPTLLPALPHVSTHLSASAAPTVAPTVVTPPSVSATLVLAAPATAVPVPVYTMVYDIVNDLAAYTRYSGEWSADIRRALDAATVGLKREESKIAATRIMNLVSRYPMLCVRSLLFRTISYHKVHEFYCDLFVKQDQDQTMIVALENVMRMLKDIRRHPLLNESAVDEEIAAWKSPTGEEFHIGEVPAVQKDIFSLLRLVPDALSQSARAAVDICLKHPMALVEGHVGPWLRTLLYSRICWQFARIAQAGSFAKESDLVSKMTVCMNMLKVYITHPAAHLRPHANDQFIKSWIAPRQL